MILNNFIVFEGIDGSGTSTQINLLKENPEAKDLLFTAEPTEAEKGKFIRRMLSGEFPVTKETQAYLFAADRNEHVNGSLVTEGQKLLTGIKEACEKGFKVLSDRYVFSSLAYQGGGSSENLVRSLNENFPLPRLLFYFDIPAEKALERVEKRGEKKEIFEKLSFLEGAVKAYKKTIESFKDSGIKLINLDAMLPKEEIAAVIRKEIFSL